LQRTFTKTRVFEFQLVEAAEVEHTSFKFQFQQKRVAYIEMNTKQLAVFELHVLKGRATKVYQTQIALIELAVGKAVVAQVGTGK
jgi:hypothetical protein